MTLAIITARGGSKRIPRKNIKDFLGKPIIAYSIETALQSGLFDEVMVSTDDVEIAEIAIKFGAKVPFFRSETTANDFATTADVLKEVLAKYDQLGQTFTYACCLYPTAPFITETLLRNAHNLLVGRDLDCIFPVQKFGFPVQRALVLANDKLAWLQPENALVRSQDLQPTFHDAGQFYFFKVAPFLQSGKLLTENTSGIEISEIEAQDIDNETDWTLAELKYQLINKIA
jgi:pseudaminic acid cytidylyltransferase